MNQAIEIRLKVESDVLRVTIVNRGEHDLWFWTRNNSWGWSMFSLLLAMPNSDQWQELTAKPVRWTRNVPRVLNLTVGGQLDYELRSGDPGWEDSGRVDSWLSQTLQVRVRLRINETPEAMTQNVFIGEALTPSCRSMPPHSWFKSR